MARRHMAQSYLTYLLLSCTGYSTQSSVRTSQWLITGTVGTCLFCSCCYVSHHIHVVSVLLIMATFVQKRALLSKLVVHLKIKYTISSKGKNMLLVWHSPIRKYLSFDTIGIPLTCIYYPYTSMTHDIGCGSFLVWILSLNTLIKITDCDHVFVGETGRTLKKRLAEHKQAVRRFNERNGIAVHVHQHDHHIDWESARVVENETFYWRRRLMEAIRINSHPSTMNLDCGLNLSNLWRPFLAKPA